MFVTAVYKITKGDYYVHLLQPTLFIKQPPFRPWLGTGLAVVQPLSHKVGVEEHKALQPHPTAEISQEEPAENLGHVPIHLAQVWQHGQQAAHGAAQTMGGQQGHHWGTAVAGLPAFFASIPLPTGIHADCQILRDHHCAQHTPQEDESEQGVDEGLLAPYVVGCCSGVPVDGWQQVAQATAQAEQEGEYCEGPATLVLAREQVADQRLHWREAGLATELEQDDAQHQQGDLQPTGALESQQGCQRGGVRDEHQGQQHAHAQGPDEGTPPTKAAPPAVAG